MAIRILVVDDHEVVRQGVKALLGTHPSCSVVAEASTGREAVEKVKESRPDLVIMDITMPDMNGLEATRKILKFAPGVEVLILTMHESDELVHQMLLAGARGYVTKSDAGKDLLAAVKALSEHKPFFTGRVSEIVLKGYLKGNAKTEVVDTTGAALTPREREIVQLIAEGKSNKEAAEILHISVKTVATHRDNIMKKLELHSVTRLVHYAIRHKIITP
jgi:DNA-binding NarL/FixJ family response regulator